MLIAAPRRAGGAGGAGHHSCTHADKAGVSCWEADTFWEPQKWGFIYKIQ